MRFASQLLLKRKKTVYHSGEMAKRYAQFCPVAHALELVGERWALLVVRELLNGPKRYTDLAAALPGIGTNILAGRLRDLERGGIVRSAATAAGRGEGLRAHALRRGAREPLYALARWGARSLGPPTPAIPSLPAGSSTRSARPARSWEGDPCADVRGHGGADEVVTVRFENGEPVVEPGSSGADVVIETDPATLFCVASREQSAREAIGAGAIRVTASAPTPSASSRSSASTSGSHASSSTSESRST